MPRIVAAVVGASALIAGCASGGSHRKADHRVGASCITAAGFGGLGARASSFAADNDGSVGRAGPTPGTAWYEILRTSRGCIVEYAVRDSRTPPLGAHQMLSLVGRSYLPVDAERVTARGSCIVWKSRMLDVALSEPYVRAFAARQTPTLPGIAVVEASRDAGC